MVQVTENARGFGQTLVLFHVLYVTFLVVPPNMGKRIGIVLKRGGSGTGMGHTVRDSRLINYMPCREISVTTY